MVTKLQKSRNFVGRTEKQRRKLEDTIKQRYVISDHETDEGLGYKIHDNKKNKDIIIGYNPRLTLETRYLEKNDKKEVVENVLDLYARVAGNIAEADLKYDKKANIQSVAEDFLESLVHKEFMPNTPTLCNAGRSLQQLSACFVLPVEDYMATDDIGEDPEKQGNGIFDAKRYMGMVHKSGGGTGFNFSHLRPKGNLISTTFGSSSGPVPFIKTFDADTDAVNQGGFRRGANMGILNYTHPDIIEFISEKVRNGTLKNFNLSVGIDDKFMKLVKYDGYFKLINPKNENTIPLEERVWKKDNVLTKNSEEYGLRSKELNQSISISEDGKSILNEYNDEEIGKVGGDGSILISAKKLWNYISENAWERGCPGVIFLDRLEEGNKTPHIGKIESTNPCGEQPLLPYEACNLGAINLATCVKNKKVDYEEIEKRINKGVHFLDNVIDMSKFPFQKIYGVVHGNRKIGLGLMGWAEMLAQLELPYDNEKSIELAKDISKYITQKGREKSEELAEKRGVFPNWEGSEWEKEGKKVRNATITTIAPNGTTGMICDVTGGIEPFFKLAYIKTCMDEKELFYGVPLFEEKLRKSKIKKKDIEKILKNIEETGSAQEIENISEKIKKVFKSSHDISPEWHVKMQSAFQSGIDNAVSKTVNLPFEATTDEVREVYEMAHELGCVGITVFRDNPDESVYSSLERKVELVQNNVELDPRIDKKPQALKYRVKRIQNDDSLHITITSELYVDDESKKAYFLPEEIFQERVPLGDARSVSFQQAGIDRTEILKGPNPNYSQMIERLQSASSNEEEGIGPKKIKSIEHAVGFVLEDCLLRNGIIQHTDLGLENVVLKKNLKKVEKGGEEYKSIISQVRIENGKEELKVKGNFKKLTEQFSCGKQGCDSTQYTFEAGCHSPKCKKCGWSDGCD